MPFQLDGLLLHLDARIGAGFARGVAIDPQQLVEQADAQLLKAEAAGKGWFA